MPELPEVETVARQLDPLVAGRRIERLVIRDRKLGDVGRERVAGARILAVRRSGKQVVFDLARGRRRTPGLFLVVHLRMTGRLLWVGDDEPLPRSGRAELLLDRGRVAFVDARRFGTIRIFEDPAELAPRGVEPLSDALTAGRLAALLGRSGQPIKPWLLRQDRLVGVGNIYASEILFAAHVDPRRAAGSLAPSEIRALRRAIRSVLQRAIECCGTTFSDFQDTRGRSGGFARLLAVYGREGEPCRRCGSVVTRIVQQQRSTFFCPGCQS